MGKQPIVEEVRSLVGRELGPSSWVTITQERIDRFAASTDDPQWIHTDPARAADGPFGATIAHGFLTLALAIRCWYDVSPVDGGGVTVNYGVNRVRFPAPVPAGTRVRGRFRVVDATDVDGGAQATISATIEREGHEKPACVAELVLRFLSS